MRSALAGSIPPLVTPFRGDRVDEDTFADLVERQIVEGSHGVLVNGTTAEPSSLTVEERNRLVDVAVRVSNRRRPVVAATGSQSLAETRALTVHAAEAGADALLIVTPYYIRPPQRGIIAYYLAAVEGISVPWMVYHIPGRAAVSVTRETLDTLAAQSPTFIGMKHAVNDLGFVSECLESQPDLRIFVGLEELSQAWPVLGDDGRASTRNPMTSKSVAAPASSASSARARR